VKVEIKQDNSFSIKLNGNKIDGFARGDIWNGLREYRHAQYGLAIVLEEFNPFAHLFGHNEACVGSILIASPDIWEKLGTKETRGAA
jgi:hypothetical protein